MKTINKLAILVIICALMVACKPKDKKPGDTGNRGNTGTTGTKTNPVDWVTVKGKKYNPNACCDANHLNDSTSLLSQRVILFGYDQATVEGQYRDIIAIHARYLRENSSATIVLEGHADERGTPEYNLALGEKRGKSVANLMRAQGVSPGQLTVVSFGEEKPVLLCSNDSCWSQNRRVRVVYTSK